MAAAVGIGGPSPAHELGARRTRRREARGCRPPTNGAARARGGGGARIPGGERRLADAGGRGCGGGGGRRSSQRRSRRPSRGRRRGRRAAGRRARGTLTTRASSSAAAAPLPKPRRRGDPRAAAAGLDASCCMHGFGPWRTAPWRAQRRAHRVAPPRAVAAEHVVERLRKPARRRVGDRGVGPMQITTTPARTKAAPVASEWHAQTTTQPPAGRPPAARPPPACSAPCPSSYARNAVGRRRRRRRRCDLHAVARVVQDPAALGRDHRQRRARRHADQHADVT